MAVPLLTAWWHCGSRLLQTSTAQAFVVFSLLPFLCFLWVWVISLTDWRLIWKQNFTKQILASSKSPFFYFRVTEDPVASNDISSFNSQRNRWFLTFCTSVDVRCFQVHDRKALSAPEKLQWFAWCVGEQNQWDGFLHLHICMSECICAIVTDENIETKVCTYIKRRSSHKVDC